MEPLDLGFRYFDRNYGNICKISTSVECLHGTTVCANSGLIFSVNEEIIATLEKNICPKTGIVISIHNYVSELQFLLLPYRTSLKTK